MRGLLDDWNANLRYGGAWDQWHSNLSQQLSTGMGGISSQLSSVLGWLNNNAGYGSNDNLKYYLQQILAATKGTGDILASNPWWATNSGFVLNGASYAQAFPDDDSTSAVRYSFPQFLSIWSSRLSQYSVLPGGPANLANTWFDMWGYSTPELALPPSQGDRLRRRGYTWFDWMSDATKSNLAFQASALMSPSYSVLTNEAQAGFTEDHTVTNAALPQHVNVISETQSDTSAGQASAAAGGQVLSAKVEELQDMLDGQKDSWITVIPEFDVGGIHVRQYEANMNTSITQACHSVMVFLWYVILFASLFNLAQTELAFYLNLGRNWTMSGGVVHGK